MIYYSIRALVNGMKLVMWMKVFRKRYGRRFTNQLYYVGGGLVLYAVYIVTHMISVLFANDMISIIATIIQIFFAYEIMRMLYKSSMKERLVSIGLLAVLAMTMDSIEVLLRNVALNHEVMENMQTEMKQTVFMFIGSCLEMLLLGIYLSEKGEKFLRHVLNCKELVPLVLVNGLISIPSWFLYNNLDWVNNNPQIINMIQKGTYFRLFMLLAGIVLFAIITISHRKRKEMNYQMKMQQMKTELEMYEQISELTQDLRTLRHDMRGNIGVIKALYESKEYDKIGEYISQIFQDIEPAEDLVIVSNKAVSIVLSQKCRMARKEGIRISSRIIAEDYGMEELDICSLLSNILDNAIESARKCPEEKRYIDFEMVEEGDGYVIRCENPYVESPVMKQEQYISSKKNAENHGYGVGIIRRLAKKYSGRARISHEMGIFIVEVYIPMVNEEAC